MDGTLLLAVGEGMGLPQLALLVLIVIVAVSAPALVRYARRRESGGREEARAAPSPSAARRVQETADQALVHLLETGREISAQIDTKIRVLNKLVKDARAESGRLEALLRASGREVPEPPAPPETETDGVDAAAPGETAAEAAEEGREKMPPSGSGRWRTTLHDRILGLSREGRAPAEIARLTRLSLSEVNLALRLLAEEERGEG